MAAILEFRMGMNTMMARFLLTLFGLLLLALGIWMAVAFTAEVKTFLIGILTVGLLLLGLLVFIIGIGERIGDRNAKANKKDE